MSTHLRTSSLIGLGLIVVLGLSISVVQAAQDGRGAGRGGRGGHAPTSQETVFFKICDHDKNQWISFREANYSLLFDRGQFGKVDLNSDGRVTRQEFGTYYKETRELIGSFKEPRVKIGDPGAPAFDDASDATEVTEADVQYDATSLQEYFGAHQSRSEGHDSFPLPPQIRGPVHHFARLDIDDDGYITIEDLELLARPIHLDVRFSAVIAILDTDDDDGVSPEEFAASMR